ncbi:MAG: rhomboid family intramembrane serine protease [Pseudomonadota bacterium]
MNAGRQIWALVGICAAIELVFVVDGLMFANALRLRQTAFEYAGFWPGLLLGWQPNYAIQPFVMFFSYGFVHGSFAHFAFNMLTLWSLGRPVADRVGGRGFLILYGVSILGGALGYAVLARSAQPMVGASGGLFGLAGGLLAWSYIDRFIGAEKLWPILRIALFLIGLNVVMYWALDGQLAWQTHLGGFLMGWVAALLIDPRARQDAP